MIDNTSEIRLQKDCGPVSLIYCEGSQLPCGELVHELRVAEQRSEGGGQLPVGHEAFAPAARKDCRLPASKRVSLEVASTPTEL